MYSTIYNLNFVRKYDIEEKALEELLTIIKEKWDDFLQNDFKKINEVLSNIIDELP